MHHELSIDEIIEPVCTIHWGQLKVAGIKKGYQMIALGVF
ncbi:hypothetical protein VCR6J2_200230 [Vibrio coralliirubri]|nr:hypothetical protein VCR6J2_200230 [Vibrio coralliirubri]CDT44582.1 hypothetical protein VCR1J2_590005 [Vibrio coralliirubri]CDU02015.1 hypothetical protein VCR8J2_850005 [Vibrio coralliirubri]